jgi:hypothetical protein
MDQSPAPDLPQPRLPTATGTPESRLNEGATKNRVPLLSIYVYNRKVPE